MSFLTDLLHVCLRSVVPRVSIHALNGGSDAVPGAAQVSGHIALCFDVPLLRSFKIDTQLVNLFSQHFVLVSIFILFRSALDNFSLIILNNRLKTLDDRFLLGE